MTLLAHLLDLDPAAPRLTVYTEATGVRMDFSGQTLDNWAAKIANMLEEELDLEPGSCIFIDLPVSWQAAVIALGAMTAGIDFELTPTPADAVFTAVDNASKYPQTDVVAVTDDPFGRGVAESGGQLPAGVIDFGPTVRFYGDQYFGETLPLPERYPCAQRPERVLSTGWTDKASFEEQVLLPLATGGSAVIIAGPVSTERLAEIARMEKVSNQPKTQS